LQWNNNRLIGTSNLVADDLYSIYVYEPADAQFKAVNTGIATLIENVLSGNIRKISFRSTDAASVQWEISYQ
ncbi:MAG: hypothetical protein WCH78_06550, partial [Bacteroidota bacterium]